jgi:ABC-type spermidine/putrescine transport system permease subunit I
MAINNDLTALNGGMDIWIRLLQLALIVAIVGTVMAIWNAYVVARTPGRHRVATAWAILIALAAAFLSWLSLDVGLLTASLNY